MSAPPRSSSSSRWSWLSRSSRRNSVSEGESESKAPAPTSTSRWGRGRSSLSAIDSNKAASIRGDVAVFMATNHQEGGRATTAGQHHPHPAIGVEAAARTDEAKNIRRSSAQSRPPLSFLNNTRRPSHQRAFSAAAALQRPSTSDGDSHLRPPQLRFKSGYASLPGSAASSASAERLVWPAQPQGPPRNIPVAMHPPREQDFITRTQMASTGIHQVTDAYSGLRHSHMGPGPAIKNVPMAYESSALERPESYNRPRRLSNSSASSSTSSVISGPDSVEGRLRNSSLSSSLTSIESLPPHSPASQPRHGSWSQYQVQNGNTWQHHAWQKPSPIKIRRKAKPGELFAALPGEVLELILEELRKLHFQPGGKSCATCWMRDCCSVAVSARKFLKYAREALYQHVQIVGVEGPLMKKRTKLNNGSRLVLLRRTLRANPHIAVIVRSLKPPALPANATAEGYNDLIASVVMACPNLERLVGFYPVYNHAFQRLFHALSTRQRLKEMDWILAPSSSQRQQRMLPSGGNHKFVPGDLPPQDYRAFLDYHLNWQQLTSLVVHCHPGATLSPGTLLERTLQRLPSLQALYLSHLPHTSFNDASLLALPPLKKLTLAFMPGVTTAGLSAMATRSASTSITSLTLIHINLESLPALARIFSNFTALGTFNLVQAYAPVMPTDERIWLFPYLASQSLRKLHWDIPYLPTRATTADNILAKSISAHGFPELRTLRAPNDPEGVFQSLCRPVERADNPIDRYRGQANHHSTLHGHGRSSSAYSRASSVASSPRSGSISKINGPPSPPFPSDDLMLPRDNSNLTLARLAAQQRLESARRFPRYFVNVIDEYGIVVEKHGVGAFIGTVESKINYKLTPDEGGTDEGGGLVGIADMLGDCGESLVVGGQGGKDGMSSAKRDKKEKKGEASEGEAQVREGCIGRWNTFSGAVVDKKDKERWWHAERGRWRGVTLS